MKHLKTIPHRDHTTWVFYQGTQAELKEVHDWCVEQFGDRVSTGCQDVAFLVNFGTMDQYRQPFIFVDVRDVVKCKLSW